MRRIRIAAATVMVAAGLIVAVAAPATAKTHTLVGELDGDPGSSVSMKVKVEHGKPKFVKSFKFSGMEVTCQDPVNPNQTVIGEVPGKIRVKAGTKPPRYKKETSDAGVDIAVSGELRKKGRLSTGEVSFSSGGHITPLCFGGPTTFVASKQ
jgi:hypothetical protein